MKRPLANYCPDEHFTEGYYGKGERGGFTEYVYPSQEQDKQLAIKWDVCSAIYHQSALFIGCARGFEVAYWLANNKYARGLDVSRWAIEHQVPESRGGCAIYDGTNIPSNDGSYDLVAAFDVLVLVPADNVQALVAEMIRVSRH